MTHLIVCDIREFFNLHLSCDTSFRKDEHDLRKRSWRLRSSEMKWKVDITGTRGGPIVASHDDQDLCHKPTDYIMTSALRKLLLLVEVSPPILSGDVFMERSDKTSRSRFGGLAWMVTVLGEIVVHGNRCMIVGQYSGEVFVSHILFLLCFWGFLNYKYQSFEIVYSRVVWLWECLR
jgi:hypothetical protein